jgi:hypothetical protein
MYAFSTALFIPTASPSVQVPSSSFCSQVDCGDASSPRAAPKSESRSRSASDACVVADSALDVAAHADAALCLLEAACHDGSSAAASPPAVAAAGTLLNVSECAEVLDSMQLQNHEQDEHPDGT